MVQLQAVASPVVYRHPVRIRALVTGCYDIVQIFGEDYTNCQLQHQQVTSTLAAAAAARRKDTRAHTRHRPAPLPLPQRAEITSSGDPSLELLALASCSAVVSILVREISARLVMGSGASATNGTRPASPPPPAALDPRLPYTPREAFKMKNNWKVIIRKMPEMGTDMMIRMFKDDPSTQQLFSKFSGKDPESLREDEDLDAQGQAVLKGMDSVIVEFQNVDKGIDILHGISKKHAQYSGFNVGMFKKIKSAFMASARDIAFGDRWNDAVEENFEKLWGFLLKYLEEGFP